MRKSAKAIPENPLILPDFLVGILERVAELLHVAQDEKLVLVEHPVPLLFVLLRLEEENEIEHCHQNYKNGFFAKEGN